MGLDCKCQHWFCKIQEYQSCSTLSWCVSKPILGAEVEVKEWYWASHDNSTCPWPSPCLSSWPDASQRIPQALGEQNENYWVMNYCYLNALVEYFHEICVLDTILVNNALTSIDYSFCMSIWISHNLTWFWTPEKNQNARQCSFWPACLQSCAIHMVAGHHPRIVAWKPW